MLDTQPLFVVSSPFRGLRVVPCKLTLAAVYAVVIQLKFQKDRLEFMNLMPLPMINIFLSFS